VMEAQHRSAHAGFWIPIVTSFIAAIAVFALLLFSGLSLTEGHDWGPEQYRAWDIAVLLVGVIHAIACLIGLGFAVHGLVCRKRCWIAWGGVVLNVAILLLYVLCAYGLHVLLACFMPMQL